jgi:hypothetical protein
MSIDRTKYDNIKVLILISVIYYFKLNLKNIITHLINKEINKISKKTHFINVNFPLTIHNSPIIQFKNTIV